MFKLELNDFIDFRAENVTEELVEKVCGVIVANGYGLCESAEEMYEFLVDGDYDGIRIHPYDEDAYTVNIEDFTFNRVLKVSDVLGVKSEEESVEVDHVLLLETINTLSQASIRTGSEKITKIVEELSEKAAEKFLG